MSSTEDGLRVDAYQAIEQHRGRPLIVYATSTRPNTNSMISGDAVRHLIDQIDSIPTQTRVLDLLLHSWGGDGLAAWKMMALLRERFDHIAVLVPLEAMSAATLLALGANEIYMHPKATLGPIDPQLRWTLPDGSQGQAGYEDLSAFYDFAKSVAGIPTDGITKITEQLVTRVPPEVLGGAQRASALSADIGARMLSLHMSDKLKAQLIAQNLNRSFYAHGDVLPKSRAKDLELPVRDDATLDGLMWRAFCELEIHMNLREPLDWGITLLKHRPAAEALDPTHGSFVGFSQISPRVDWSHIHSCVESVRLGTAHIVSGYIIGRRLVDMNLQFNAATDHNAWKVVYDHRAGGS